MHFFIALEAVLLIKDFFFFKLNKVILKAFKEADLASLLQSIPKAVSPALVQMYLQTKAFPW